VAPESGNAARSLGLPRDDHSEQREENAAHLDGGERRDNYQNRDAYHDWVVANEHMARVLADKGYPYQFLFTRNAGHCDPGVRSQTLPLALEYIWQGVRK
jgi:hypothetical protein